MGLNFRCINKISKILKYLTAIILIIIITAPLVLQIPFVQTVAVKIIINSFSGYTDADISVEKVYLRPFNTLLIKNLTIKDKHPFCTDSVKSDKADTVLHVPFFGIVLNNLLFDKSINIGRINLKNTYAKICIEPSGHGKTTNFQRIFKIKSSGSSSPKVKIAAITGENMTVKLKNATANRSHQKKGVIDINDVELRKLNLHAEKIKIDDNFISVTLKHLSLEERSGYKVENLEGGLVFGKEEAVLSNFLFSDRFTKINIPQISLQFDKNQEVKNILSGSKIACEIAESYFCTASLGYFFPKLKDKKAELGIRGRIEGGNDELNFSGIKIFTADKSIEGNAECTIFNIKDKNNLMFNASINNLLITTGGVENMAKEFIKSGLDISKYAKDQTILINGYYFGKLNNFEADQNIRVGNGNISSFLNIEHLADPKQPINLTGSLQTENVDLGKLTGTNKIKDFSIYTKFHATLASNPEINIDTLFISKFSALGYEYSNFAATGTYKNNTFNGKVACNDPNLNFLFKGIVSFNNNRRQNSVYNFSAKLRHADLHALNLYHSPAKISFDIGSNFERDYNSGMVTGDILIDNLRIEDKKGKRDIGNIKLNSFADEKINTIKLTSSIAEASYSGSKFIDVFVKDFLDLTLNKELYAISNKHVKDWSGNKYNLSLKLKKPDEIVSFLVPGIYISDNTSFKMSISEKGEMDSQFHSDIIGYNDKYIKDANLFFHNKEGFVTFDFQVLEFKSTPLTLMRNRFVMYANQNHLGISYSYDNNTELINQGEFFITNDFYRNDKNILHFNTEIIQSDMFLNSKEWIISPSKVNFSQDGIEIDDLSITSEGQKLNIHGGISRYKKDSLSIKIDRFNLDNVNKFTLIPVNLQGILSGTADIVSPTDKLGILLDLQSKSTHLGGRNFGDLFISSKWNENIEGFDIACSNLLNDKNNLNVTASFIPKGEKIDAEVRLDDFDLSYISPFVKSVFNTIKGKINGTVGITGNLKKPSIISKKLDVDGNMTLAFTNVNYDVKGPVSMSPSGLVFENVMLQDRFGEKGAISGGIMWDNFKKIKMDTHISMKNMEALNTKSSDNPHFYGNVFGTGKIDITGEINKMTISIDAATVKDGKFFIPLSNGGSLKKSNLLKFKKDSSVTANFERFMTKQKETKNGNSDLSVQIKLDVTPSTQAIIDIDKELGNLLAGNGRGHIDLDIRPGKDIFGIRGSYNLTGGEIHYNAFGLATKNFSLKEGSNIKFSGNVMESELNINAIYKAKANIGTLIGDTTVTRKRNVDCGINMSGKLKNPKISFSINIPDLDPTVKAKVESALSTDDKIQKQFVALLLTGSFMPNEQSGIVNNTSILYSNVTEFMSNQLNYILRKFDIPVDFGIDYQHGNNGKNALDVNVSTELFNNRVIVNGTIGNRKYTNKTGTSEFVGDLDIEIKLNKSGNLRLNLFSHSADQFSAYLDNSQRSGIGISIQNEFNTIKEFIVNLFTGKKKREEKQSMSLAIPEKKTKIEVKE